MMDRTCAVWASIGMFVAWLVFSCRPNLSIETAQYAVNGQKRYAAHCQNCHGAKGEGLGRLYPPLTDSAYLNANRSELACIVKNGMSGTIQVSGETYDGQMPANPDLTDVDMAYILTYVTTTFGNSTVTYTTDEVKTGLENCMPDDVKSP